jgi:ribosomal-protein-alanine N-acetyltransferase
MKLRPLFQEDLPSMADIEAVCSKNPWGFGMLKEAVVLRGGFGLGVEEGGRLLGFGLFYRVLDECQVMTLCVHPGHRRRGVGRLLMEGAKKAASRQGAEKMSLEVRKSNVAAQGLYAQLGFFRVGVRKGYYRDGEDAVLMDCLLKEGT